MPNITPRNFPTPPRVSNGAPPYFNSSLPFRGGRRINTDMPPILRFTDLISGPATGLGDGLGDGVIVTIWGQGFGDDAGEVSFTDSAGITRPAAHIYYWKRADGNAPGGPANLYKSHLMYEIAFSIPSGSADGLGSISITDANGVESVNDLPFTVREGRILWVAPEGNNSNAGTFAEPKEFINSGNSSPIYANNLGRNLLAGDTVYSRGVTEPDIDGTAMFISAAEGTAENQIAIVAYPSNEHSVLDAVSRGCHPYQSRGIVLSKYYVSVAQLPISGNDNILYPSPHDTHIRCSADGRVIGNYLRDRDDMCASGFSGAIYANGNGLHNQVIMGNHIYDIGCDGTSHYHHTTYLSVRWETGMPAIGAPDIQFNYLDDCKAKFGIHIYDEVGPSGVYFPMTGHLVIKNNVVVDQKGAGINVQTQSNVLWEGLQVDIANNLLINCGLGPVGEVANGTDPTAIRVRGHLMPEYVNIQENAILGFSDADSRIYSAPYAIFINLENNQPEIRIDRNIIFTDSPDFNLMFLGNGVNNLTSSHNVTNFLEAAPDGLDFINGQSGVVLQGKIMYLLDGVESNFNSAPIEQYDLYGRLKSGNSIGPVEVFQ